jgi:cell division protein FtsW
MATPLQPADSHRARFLLNPAAIMVVCAIALTSLGVTILFSASAAFIIKGVNVPYFYLQKQVIGAVGAGVLCFVVSRINLDELRRYAWWIAGGLVVLLFLVLLTHPTLGSRRWLGFGAAKVQVSEFAKLGVVFCLAHYLALNQSRIGDFKRGFLWPLVIIGVPVVLIQREPDFGCAALIGVVGLVLLFVAGAKLRYFIPSAAIALTGFVALVIQDPVRMKRVLAFLDPEGTRQGTGYQNWQALLAFASGGADGVGLGQGRQQLNFLPEAHTDMILAVVGEELGLWFTLGVVALFLVILVAGLIHLRRAPNLFQFLLVTGSLLLMCLQAVINLGVVTALLPNKGMPLPFISAGLSNLLLMGLLLGIMLNTQRTWGRAVLPGRARAMREVLA